MVYMPTVHIQGTMCGYGEQVKNVEISIKTWFLKLVLVHRKHTNKNKK